MERTLRKEVHDVELRVNHHGSAVKQALTNVVCTSPEFLTLFDERDQGWIRLRTLCAVFLEILHACAGNMPDKLRMRFLATEPLEAGLKYRGDNGIVPYRVDDDLLNAWKEALAALANNADAELPEPS